MSINIRLQAVILKAGILYIYNIYIYYILVKSRLKWAGHVERMKEDRLPRVAYVHQDRGKRGRPADHSKRSLGSDKELPVGVMFPHPSYNPVYCVTY